MYLYELRGETITTPPANSEDWEQCVPNYEEFTGWNEEISPAPPLLNLYLQELTNILIDSQNFVKHQSRLLELGQIEKRHYSETDSKLIKYLRFKI